MLSLSGHDGGVSSLCISPVEPFTLCSTSLDKSVILWDIRSGVQISALKGHRDCVNTAIFVSDGRRLITGGDDKTVLIWDPRNSAAPLATQRGFGDGINKFALASNGTALFSACDDGVVYTHTFGPDDGKLTLVDKVMVSGNTANDVLYHCLETGEGDVLVTCGEDASVRTWKIVPTENPEDRIISSVDEFEAPVNHIAIHGTMLFAASAQGVFALSVTPAGEVVFAEEYSKVFYGHDDYVRGLEVIGSCMLTVSDDGTAIEWNLETARPTRRLKLSNEQIMAQCLVYHGGAPTHIVTGGEDQVISVWSLPFAEMGERELALPLRDPEFDGAAEN